MKNKRLYIVDIDHTLIISSFSQIASIPLVSKRKNHFLYHRPFLSDFLKYLSKTGEVVFYTSAKKDYANWILKTFNFNFDFDFDLFTRKFCRVKYDKFGVFYYKSIDFLPIDTFNHDVIVIDDRIDLWLDNNQKIKFIDLKPYNGEIQDSTLLDFVIKQLKNQPKIE